MSSKRVCKRVMLTAHGSVLASPAEDKCESFCEPIVAALLAHEEVQKTLALSSPSYGLNLVQWAMRDCVRAVYEKEPWEVMPFVFVTRMEFYEAELTGSQNPEVRRVAEIVKRAQTPTGVDTAPIDLPHDGTAYVDEL